MKDLASLGLRIEGGRILVLDQRLLPDEERWVPCGSPDEMAAMILALQIRGAPLIGVAAAVALGRFAESGASANEYRAAALRLRAARPTAVNLMWAVDRMLAAADPTREAERIFDEDVRLCDAIARNGASLLGDGEGVLTHCNSGGLATAGVGTALGAIVEAHRQGKRIHVWVDETRPLLQGARLTTWELARRGVPYTLICDNMAGAVMAAGRVQKVIVGADRIARNGDFANKVGTYGVAVLARHHGIPFFAAAPYTTVDPACPDGRAIPIEERAHDEVRGARGAFGQARWSPEGSPAFNPAFDVTPARLLEAIVLDTGVFEPSRVCEGIPAEVKSG